MLYCETSSREDKTTPLFHHWVSSQSKGGYRNENLQGDEVEWSHAKHLAKETLLASQGVHHDYNKVEYGVLLKLAKREDC